MKAVDAGPVINKLNTNTYYQPGFAPGLGYAYNSGAKTVTFTEKGAVPAGDAFKIVNIEVHDQFGNPVKSSIAAATGNTGALSLATLNASKPLRATATVVTNAGCISDGSTDLNAAAGDLQNWDKDFSSAEAQA